MAWSEMLSRQGFVGRTSRCILCISGWPSSSLTRDDNSNRITHAHVLEVSAFNHRVHGGGAHAQLQGYLLDRQERDPCPALVQGADLVAERWRRMFSAVPSRYVSHHGRTRILGTLGSGLECLDLANRSNMSGFHELGRAARLC